MKRAVFLSAALVLLMALPAVGHGPPETQQEALQFKAGFTYEIRYTPIATDKITSITFTIIGKTRTLGMREILTGITPEGETWHLPIDLILDIREIRPMEPASSQAPEQKIN